MTRPPDVSGLEYMQAIRDKRVPPAPIQTLLGFFMIEAEEGRTAFTLTPRAEHYNPIGVVHGGVAGTLLDSAMGAAVHTTLPVGEGYTTLETKFNLVRAIKIETGPITARGHVVHRGSRVATAEGTITRDSDGALLAHGTSTCLVL